MSLEPTPPELSPLDRQNVVALEPDEPSTARRVIVEAVQTIALALLMFLVINFLTARIRVDGRSMEPNFHDGDYVIVNRLAFQFGELQRGDVIVFPYPLNQDEDYIKRIIALPGDRVAIRDGRVILNGAILDEDYLGDPPHGNDMAVVIVQEGDVFVMGDNRYDSSDSRSWGPLSIEDIIGKAIYRYWPLADIGSVIDQDMAFALP
jgi:signal peptidase I